MRVEPGMLRTPEIGRVWLNSPSVSFRQLRGRAALIDFSDSRSLNSFLACLPCKPGMTAAGLGLSVIGIPRSEFTAAQYESNVNGAVPDFGLTDPAVVMESN
jgi:hypothetical protein